ncbi:MAG: DUF2345 domain-containing protein, partial [Yersiniaceae bacterium]|nr:DUF2345 domain-containing protein [Yersiniaceae bacterium]
TGELSLKSGEGPVEIQAQNSQLNLFAEKKLSIASESDIILAGKKRITLIGGGSYLILDAGKIEYGTLGWYQRKVKRTFKGKAASQEQSSTKMAASLPNLPCGPFSACFRVTDIHTGNEDIPFAWQVTSATGVIQGQTESALTRSINTDNEEPITLNFIRQTRAGIR